jgi:addiction module HigA family antidote
MWISIAPGLAATCCNKGFLAPHGLRQNPLARAIGVPPPRINEIVHCERDVTADAARRLSRVFATSAELWMSQQASRGLERTAKRAAAAEQATNWSAYSLPMQISWPALNKSAGRMQPACRARDFARAR